MIDDIINGEIVWVLERDENNEVYDYGGYVFVAEVNGYVLCPGTINQHENIDYILGYYYNNYIINGEDAELVIARVEDCFLSEYEASHVFNQLQCRPKKAHLKLVK